MSDCLPFPSCSLFMLQHLTEKCAVVLCADTEPSSNKNVSGQAEFLWHCAPCGAGGLLSLTP